MMRVNLKAGPIAVHAIWFCVASIGTNVLALRYGCHFRLSCSVISNLLLREI
jgi:hypothetical protein